MPVYYENHDGPRYSILSEMVQAQPYRPRGTVKSQKRTYQENINQQTASRPSPTNAMDPDNPFAPIASGPTEQSPLPVEDRDSNSGKTGHFLKQSAPRGPVIPNWQTRESNPEAFNRRRPADEDKNMHGGPFALHLGTHMDSEPTQASYLQQRHQLMKKY